MKRIAFGLALLVGLHGPAAAPELAMVYGFGSASCGYWLEARANAWNPRDNRFLQGREWMSGFVTAYNWYLSADPDVAKGTDEPGMYAWLDQYCREKPTMPFAKAVEQLIDHLTRR